MKTQTRHWLLQRLSAVPLALLFFYFVGQVESLTARSHADFTAWLQQPFPAGAAAVFILCAFYHGRIGVDEIIEDYVPEEAKRRWKRANALSFLILGGLCLLALAKIYNG